MTYLSNAPDDFVDEAKEGFVAAYPGYVRAVPGGVVRSTATSPGSVAVVIGGGSGHFPTFGGLVGAGLAHGAAMGGLFASPSHQQVYSVARNADIGGGVLLSYGNYAGDVINFDAAQERLRAEGIPTETVRVTDDVASAPAAERERRRGIAGDLVVFKIAGAASEEGADLAETARLARHANDRTRSFGVAFGGCVLPGADAALFTVAPGRMAVGLGIHGEPGIDDVPIPTADGLASLLVERLLDELPDDVESARGARVVPILNGLGSIKYEEMFVVHRSVDRLLRDAGVDIVDPQVGEFCTSFDMAGVSLTLVWLDEELERLWTAPVDTPGYRRGSLAARPAVPTEAAPVLIEEAATFPPAAPESQAAARIALRAMESIAETVRVHMDELGRIDSIAGDGDHGYGMHRGASAALEAATSALDAGAGAGSLLRSAGDAWSGHAGGTSGVLWGSALEAFGGVLGDEERPTRDAVVSGIVAAARRIRELGKAEPGDKTMVDAIIPFTERLQAAAADGAGLAEAWRSAAAAARVAADDTSQLVPRRGRSRTHGDKSLGTVDPGALSFALIVTGLAGILDGTVEGANDGRAENA